MKKARQIGTIKSKQMELLDRVPSDYTSLTDIARYKKPHESKEIIKNWLSAKSTIGFFSIWEQLHNPHFKVVEFAPNRNSRQ